MFFEDAVSDVSEFQVGVSSAGECKPHDRLGVDIDLLNYRIIGFARERATNTRHAVTNVVGGLVDIAAELELDGNNGTLLLTGRSESLDAFDGGELFFENVGYFGLDDVGASASVERSDGDNWRVDVRIFTDR